MSLLFIQVVPALTNVSTSSEIDFGKDFWALYCDFPGNDYKVVKVLVIIFFKRYFNLTLQKYD